MDVSFAAQASSAKAPAIRITGQSFIHTDEDAFLVF